MSKYESTSYIHTVYMQCCQSVIWKLVYRFIMCRLDSSVNYIQPISFVSTRIIRSSVYI